MNKDELIYTSTFKLYNVEIESDRIELSENAWVESNPVYAQPMPKHFASSMMFGSTDPIFGLSRFFLQLFASQVVITTTHTAEEAETNPFDLHECSYIAMAISILTDDWFVAGVGAFFNSRDGNQLGANEPYTSMFKGKRGGKTLIKKADESTLKRMYDFVYQALRSANVDERRRKLLFLYFGCIIKSSTQSLAVLKTGFPSPFSGDGGAIIYGALFFEHIFAKESDSKRLPKGIDTWNNLYHSEQINKDEVMVLMNFRHTLVHDDATRAYSELKRWQNANGVSDDKLMRKLEDILIKNVKQITRAIVLDFNKYTTFRTSLP